MEGTNKELSAELRHVKKQLQDAEARVLKLEKEQAEMQNKVEHLEEKLLGAKAKLRGQNLRVLDLCQVRTLFLSPNVICVPLWWFLCFCFISN